VSWRPIRASVRGTITPGSCAWRARGLIYNARWHAMASSCVNEQSTLISTLMDKAQVTAILEEIAVLLELKGENPFKALAYTKAARALDAYDGEIAPLVAENRLGSVSGIGDALCLKITELVRTGKLDYYEKLRASVPAGLLAMMEIPALGPKKIKALHEKLGIESVDDLEAACRAGRVRALAGFGAKTEEKILAGIAQSRVYAEQFVYPEAWALAEELRDALRGHGAVGQVSVAGSVRRGVELVRNIDLVASSRDAATVLDDFGTWADVTKIVRREPSSATVLLASGISATLRVVPENEYAFALHHFTGSAGHNAQLCNHAAAQGKNLTERGLFAITRGAKKDAEKSIPCRSEHELFAALDLQEIPPELREGLGEIDAAATGKIPRLIEWMQLRGTFHCHTNASDGKNTLTEMAAEARDLGLTYLGIADHSRSSIQANGLSEERLAAQVEEIRKLNAALDGFHIFAGSEVDILKDGRLDFGDDVLRKLDYVVASVHNVLNQDEDTMTARLIRAMENEYVTMLGHPSGRRLLQREASRVNFEKIIDCAARTGTWIELNCSTWRMDLDWRWWRQARDRGVKCVINPDAHRLAQFASLRHGVTAARKGWLRCEDVMNTQTLEEIRRALAKKRN
jgi:DNA polymerase (family 10)